MIIIIFKILHMVSSRDMVGFFHACVTGCTALYYVPYLMTANIESANDVGRFCAKFTLQYMIYDLMYCEKIEYVFHHSLAIIACSFVLYTKTYETLVLYVEVNEVSTIFLGLAYMNILKKINQFIFVLTFIICRIMWLPWIIWNKRVDGALRFIMYVHYALQLFWLAKIYKKIIRLISG